MNRIILVAAVLPWSTGCTVAHDSIPRCVPGMSVACACTDGTTGAQTCDADGAYLACTCPRDAAVPADAGGCVLGETVACLCPDGVESAATCNDRGLFLPCLCGRDGGVFDAPDVPLRRDTPRPDGPLCFAPEPEFCDGRDNDCDGLVDDDFACPDDTVVGTLPFDGGVWHLGGVARDGACVVQQIWPTVHPVPVPATGCGGTVSSYGRAMHPTEATFYAPDDGILRRLTAGTTTIVTTPCTRVGWCGLDPLGRLYFRCDDEHLYRAPDEDLGARRPSIEAVMIDGGLVTSSDIPPFLTLLSPDGRMVSSPDLSAYPGRLERVDSHVIAYGNFAFAVLQRVLYDTSREAIVVRVDASSGEWSVVRRFPIAEGGLGWAPTALPDGHVIARPVDPLHGASPDIVVYPPSGATAVLWTDLDDHDVWLYRSLATFVGPRL